MNPRLNLTYWDVAFFDRCVVCFSISDLPNEYFGVLHARGDDKLVINLQLENGKDLQLDIGVDELDQKNGFRFRPAVAEECRGMNFSFGDRNKKRTFKTTKEAFGA